VGTRNALTYPQNSYSHGLKTTTMRYSLLSSEAIKKYITECKYKSLLEIYGVTQNILRIEHLYSFDEIIRQDV